MSDSYNDSASIGDQSHLLPSSTRSRFLVYLSTSSAPHESRNLADETSEALSTDEVAIIFSFLSYDEIMYARVCTTWRDAAKKTLVPLTEFVVDNVRSYKAMRVMSTALPNLQQLTISNLGHGRKYHKYTDGEDPDEGRAAITANDTAFDIDIISRFSKLRILKINMAPLNGRYPVLFNFPLLQKLTISDFKNCSILKWDLEMLSGLPSLKELFCENNSDITGSLSSLRVLKDTLEKVKFIDCRRVEGNLMDLADFPRLKELGLSDTAVTGDIRDINGHDFPALEYLSLPKGVYGGIGYEFEDISDVPEFMQAIHHLLQRSPTLFKGYDSPLIAFHWKLSRDSPDWYSFRERRSPSPPFRVELIQAGSRRGWWWYSGDCGNKIHSCEINWLDPEPSSECSDYEAYIEKQLIERNINFYRGYHQPPTEEEYRRLCEGLP